jgi:hypothetical protein
MTDSQQDETIKDRIIVLLQKGYKRGQLINDFGLAERTVDAAIRAYKELGNGDEGNNKENGSPLVDDEVSAPRSKSTSITKALPLEAIVESLPWPVDVDGHVDGVFVAGMRYEAINVIRGIRLAQELSKMGVDQATPVIKMAQKMRQAEGEAAKTVAQALAQATLEGNREILAALNNLNLSTKAASPDPMQRMIGMMQNIPQMFNAMNALMSLFGMKPVMGQQPQAQTPQNLSQGQPPL